MKKGGWDTNTGRKKKTSLRVLHRSFSIETLQLYQASMAKQRQKNRTPIALAKKKYQEKIHETIHIRSRSIERHIARLNQQLKSVLGAGEQPDLYLLKIISLKNKKTRAFEVENEAKTYATDSSRAGAIPTFSEPPVLSQLELIRQENINRNEQFLQSLGLTSLVQPAVVPTSSPPITNPPTNDAYWQSFFLHFGRYYYDAFGLFSTTDEVECGKFVVRYFKERPYWFTGILYEALTKTTRRGKKPKEGYNVYYNDGQIQWCSIDQLKMCMCDDTTFKEMFETNIPCLQKVLKKKPTIDVVVLDDCF